MPLADGNAVLIESVELTELDTKFKVFQQAVVVPKDGVIRQARTTVPQRLPSAPAKIELAQAPYTPKGWVLDYIVSGSTSSYTFTNGATYLITNSFTVGDTGGGTANFQPNACVKYATNAYLMLIGGVSFQTNGTPTVFTSKDDNCYGSVITDTGYGSTGIPTNSYGPALSVYFPGHSITIANARIRWDKRAISMSESSGISVSHAVKNSKFENNWHGIYEYLPSGSLTLTADTYINQSSNVYNPSGYLNGSMAASGDLFNLTKSASYSEAETYIAINPLNRSNIVATSLLSDSANAFPGILLCVTTNVGASWTNRIIATGQTNDLPQG